MNHTKVSVIMPSLNVAPFIQECIESVCRQSLKELEIICVDAGSTDGTLEILETYREKDNRIKIIISDKKSYGYQVNLGIQQACGEYIGIVETDDYIHSDMYEKMYEIAAANRLDFVKCNYEGFVSLEENRQFVVMNRLKDESYYNTVIEIQKTSKILPYVGYNIWSGLYRTKFLREKQLYLHESPGASYQDIGFGSLTAVAAERVLFLKEAYYYYRMDNEGSSVKAGEKFYCIPEEFQWLEERMKELKYWKEKERCLFFIEKLGSYHWNYSRLAEEYREKFLNYIRDEKWEAFDENQLEYKIPNKEFILKLCAGDRESIQYQEKLEKKREETYHVLKTVFEKEKEIVVVSAGVYAEAVLELAHILQCEKIVAVCDNSVQKIGTSWKDFSILDVRTAVDQHKTAFFVIANKYHALELKKQLNDYGIEDSRILECSSFDRSVEVLKGIGCFVR